MLPLISKIRVVPLVICGVSLGLGLIAGLILSSDTIPVNDKLQHFICFLVFGISFYWIFDLSKKRATQLTAVTVGAACVISEVSQAYLTTRIFDFYDIAANVLGLLCSLTYVSCLTTPKYPLTTRLNNLYHSRMLQRKRAAKYAAIPDQEVDVPADNMLDNLASEPTEAHAVDREAVEALA